MCLEEMLSVDIPKGYLYYGELRHRVEIAFTAELRTLVKEISVEMHNYFSRGYTPCVKPFKGCRSCSLADVCLPVLQGKVIPASKYIKQQVEEP
jgi:CRISPR-associated exonuclease Cas4